VISGTKGTQHATGITELCRGREEGSITTIPCYTLCSSPPDIKGNHSVRETETYWEEMACGENPGFGSALCIPVRQEIFCKENI